MRALANFSIALLYSALAVFRNRGDQAIVELALRQQLSVYARIRPRPRLSPFDRAFWIALSRLWPRWKEHLVLVRPATVVRWHRQGFGATGDPYPRLARADPRSRKRPEH